MRLSIAALAAVAATAHAFRDTSPFLIYTSSQSGVAPLLGGIQRSQIQNVESVVKKTKSYLESCPTHLYYIISQPSLSSQDVTTDSFPMLSQHLRDAKSKATIAEVKGLEVMTAQKWIDEVHVGCVSVDTKEAETVSEESVSESMTAGNKVVVRLQLDGVLPTDREERYEMLRHNDARISTLLRTIPEDASYTVLFTTTPLNISTPKAASKVQESVYTPEFEQEAVHMDLKRNLITREGEEGNGGIPKKLKQNDFRPLFEKYQFLTPGLFMGLLAGLLLLSILGVGLNAISSLQVSYAAFDKEMGPAAQRKQQ